QSGQLRLRRVPQRRGTVVGAGRQACPDRSDSPSLTSADRGNEPAVRTPGLLENIEAALFPEQPVEGFGCVDALDVEADALAALQRNLLAGHRGGDVALGAEVAGDEVEAGLALVAFVVEADLAILLGNSQAGQQCGEEAAHRGIVAAGHAGL